MTHKIKIAYIGYGFVGKACESVFADSTDSIIIDPAYENAHNISILSDTDVNAVFVAINAPTLPDNSVDASAIYSVFRTLESIGYKGLVILKSTLPPDIVEDLASISSNFSYVYSPEFLRERYWQQDAKNPSMLVFGGPREACRAAFDLYRIYSVLPGGTECRFLDYKTASLTKYAINTFLAMKVVFMNQLSALYADINPTGDWSDIRDTLCLDERLGNSHFSVPGPDGLRGYGGSCFPKDIAAAIGFDKNSRMTLLRETVLSNTQLRLS